jgi:L-ribulokinase
MAFTLGIDYGTNSVRAIVVDCSNGVEIGSCVVDYPTGVMKELARIKEEQTR